MKTLQDLFLNELADVYDAERRIVQALPKMGEAATCEQLQTAIQAHLKETEGHVTKVEQIFERFDTKPRAKTCKATVGLLEEAIDVAKEFENSPAINAALISSLQKVEHYEMATYSCLYEWADVLGNDEVKAIVGEILAEEIAANDALSELAMSSSNDEALGSEVEDEEEEPTKLVAA